MSAAFICALGLTAPSMACTSFKAEEVQQVSTAAEANGGYQISDSQCELLKRNSLVLHVVGYGAVLSGVAVGRAEVRLQEAALGAISDQTGLSTFVNSAKGTQEFADQLLVAAVRDAIGRLNFEVADGQIDGYRKNASAGNAAPQRKAGESALASCRSIPSSNDMKEERLHESL